jgi:hypothetical protein
MIGKSVGGWHWQWKDRFLRLWSPKGRVAAVIGFNEKLGWLWSLADSPGHRAKDQETAVREVLNALEMPDRVRAELLSIILHELARIAKIEAENDADFGGPESNDTKEAENA